MELRRKGLSNLFDRIRIEKVKIREAVAENSMDR
jgi:hypothetical protein